jgi:hypothetical protein
MLGPAMMVIVIVTAELPPPTPGSVAVTMIGSCPAVAGTPVIVAVVPFAANVRVPLPSNPEGVQLQQVTALSFEFRV